MEILIILGVGYITYRIVDRIRDAWIIEQARRDINSRKNTRSSSLVNYPGGMTGYLGSKEFEEKIGKSTGKGR